MKQKKEKVKREKVVKEPKRNRKPKAVKEPKAPKAPKAKAEKKTRKRGVSIRIQLIAGFVIPILFVVLVGVISYTKASEGLTKNYEESSVSALQMMMNSYDESMNSVVSIGMELAQDSTVRSYALGGYLNDVATENQAKTTIKNNLNVKVTSNSLIENIHIMPVADEYIVTTKRLSAAEFQSVIDELAESEDSVMLKNAMPQWGTAHPFFDEAMEIEAGSYAMYCSMMFNSGAAKAIVVTDISTEAIRSMISQLEFGDGSYVCFYNNEGLEVSTDENFSIASVDEQYLNTDEDVAQYIDYNGKEYFLMQKKSASNDSKIAVLVPKSHITQSSDDIKSVTMILVVVACVVAILISTILISSIGKNINKNVKQLEKVSRGELLEIPEGRVKVRNEFGKLHHALVTTVRKMRELLLSVSSTKDNVLTSFDQVKDSALQLNGLIESVSGQIEEINDNIARENQDISGCNQQMENLSVRIKTVNNSMKEIMEQVADSKKMIGGGMQTVEEMMEQSQNTSKATLEVQEQVQNLGERMEQVSDFVDIIQSISEETNLLSLNASIEAARAGDAGRGFAVVAEEIRKLSDNTAKTVNEIHNIISEIDMSTKSVIDKVEEAEEISSIQVNSAKSTITAFTQINDFMETLTSCMQHVSEDVTSMNVERKKAMEAIQSIGASSENSVISTQEVNRILGSQLEASSILEKETIKMSENIMELQKSIETFILE